MYLMVGSVDNDERKEAIAECLIEHLEEAVPVTGLHSFIILILLKLLLHSVKKETAVP